MYLNEPHLQQQQKTCAIRISSPRNEATLRLFRTVCPSDTVQTKASLYRLDMSRTATLHCLFSLSNNFTERMWGSPVIKVIEILGQPLVKPHLDIWSSFLFSLSTPSRCFGPQVKVGLKVSSSFTHTITSTIVRATLLVLLSGSYRAYFYHRKTASCSYSKLIVSLHAI